LTVDQDDDESKFLYQDDDESKLLYQDDDESKFLDIRCFDDFLQYFIYANSNTIFVSVFTQGSGTSLLECTEYKIVEAYFKMLSFLKYFPLFRYMWP
jgi:hypothetical protein